MRKLLAIAISAVIFGLGGCASDQQSLTSSASISVTKKIMVGDDIDTSVLEDDQLSADHYSDIVGSSDGDFYNKCNKLGCTDYSLPSLVASSYLDYVFAQIVVVDTSRISEKLSGGNLTIKKILDIRKHKDSLYYVDMTGAKLKDYLHKIAGPENKLGAYIEGVPSIVGGVSNAELDLSSSDIDKYDIENNRLYRVVTSLATASGNNGFPRIIDTQYGVNTGYQASSVLRVYLEGQPWIVASHYRN